MHDLTPQRDALAPEPATDGALTAAADDRVARLGRLGPDVLGPRRPGGRS